MLTVPKLAHQPQARNTQIQSSRTDINSAFNHCTPVSMNSTKNNIKAQIVAPNAIKGKQNIPIKKRDQPAQIPMRNLNQPNMRIKTQPSQDLPHMRFLPQNNQKRYHNKTPSKNKKTSKRSKEFFSPQYLKQRQENQKILQSLKLENEKYKKLIQQNECLFKRQNYNQNKEFNFSIQPQKVNHFTPNMKKTPKKQMFAHTRRALEEMTNLTTSFIVDDDIDTSCSSFSSFNLSNTFNFKKIQSIHPTKHHFEDFEKIKFLGKGNFGEVNLVRHRKTNFICAMKIIKKSFVKEENVIHQISREIRIHLSLKHLNIIGFYGFFDDNENVYLLIEYATGGELYQRLKQCYRMPQKEVVPIIRNALDGLKMIHSLGYIHRDLKPENMIFQFGIGKICDLGWAADCGFNQMRKSYCGTPLYLPPEMIRKELYDQSADIWSIGILTYELIVGKIPFNIWSEYDLQQIVDKEITFPTDYVDMSLDSIDFIKKCLNKDPTKRMKLDQLTSHPFLKIAQTEGYFNVDVYDGIEKLFP